MKGLVSPRGMLLVAFVIAALLTGAHALGLRAYTAVLSGTAPPGTSVAEGTALGVLYAALWFAGVVAAPILALAAAVMWGLGRRGRGGVVP